MISGKEELFQLIEEGRRGNNIGLTIGSPKLEVYMDGLLPGTSYLIGAASGVGCVNQGCTNSLKRNSRSNRGIFGIITDQYR